MYYLNTLLTSLFVTFGFLGSLSAWGPIQSSGSDPNAVLFNSFKANNIAPFIVPQGQTFNGVSDPSNLNLTLASNSSVRVYFINTYAAFDNRLGVFLNTTGSPNPVNDIFTDPHGLQAGQFVTIGNNIPAGTVLNFYLQPNNGQIYAPLIFLGVNFEPNSLFWTKQAFNTPSIDATIPHVKELVFNNPINNAEYVLMGWEDWSKSNQFFNNNLDYNDMYVVAEIIPHIAVPEPSTYLILGTLLGIGFYVHARRKKSLTA